MSFCFQIISKAILDTWKHFLDLFQEKGLSESLCLTLNWNTRKPDLRQQNERSLRCLNSCDFHFCGNEICLFQGKFLNLKVSQAHLYFLTRYSIVTLVILLCITNLYKFCLHVLILAQFSARGHISERIRAWPSHARYAESCGRGGFSMFPRWRSRVFFNRTSLTPWHFWCASLGKYQFKPFHLSFLSECLYHDHILSQMV